MCKVLTRSVFFYCRDVENKTEFVVSMMRDWSLWVKKLTATSLSDKNTTMPPTRHACIAANDLLFIFK